VAGFLRYLTGESLPEKTAMRDLSILVQRVSSASAEPDCEVVS
jgi:hypothetical protein